MIVGLVFFPTELQAQNDIIIGGNSSLLSETRAPGAAILAASFFMLVGAFRARFSRVALIIGTLFFLSYGAGRVLSIVLDGLPADGLFYAMIGELVMGMATLMVLLREKGRSVAVEATA